MDGVPVGVYLREAVQEGATVRRVTVVGEKQGEPEVDDEWLVFSRPVHTEDGELGGHVEIAWLTAEDEDGRRGLRAVKPSPLVVFFPTVVETRLGFLIQGPYRTTPSRDNVPPRDEWNRMCVRETGALLVESLRWFARQRSVGCSRAFLPSIGPGWVRGGRCFAGCSKRRRRHLAGRNCCRPSMAPTCVPKMAVWRVEKNSGNCCHPPNWPPCMVGARRLHWLERTISRDRTPELRRYVVQELGIRELTPEAVVKRLTGAFLEDQTDDWTHRLYEFLASRPALRSRVISLPIIRLSDGSHVPPFAGDERRAFLPGPVDTGFSDGAHRRLPDRGGARVPRVHGPYRA